MGRIGKAWLWGIGLLVLTAGAVALLTLLSHATAQAAPRWQRPIVIGWTPPDITGVFKTATEFFERAAREANARGFNVQVISRSPATHVAFADQVAIVEDYIQRRVDVIAISPIEVEVVRPVLAQARRQGIPVIVVNLLEEIPGVDVNSYIGFDNTVAAKVTAYAVADYFGGPGVLGTGRRVNVSPEAYLDLSFWENLYKNLTPAERNAIRAQGAIIEGVAGGFFSVARLKGFRSVVEQFPNLRILGQPCAADWNREKGARCAEAFLQANPRGLDFIWAASNEMGLGAMLVAERLRRLELAQEGPRVGDARVAIFTNDLTPESADRIAEGKIIAETTHGFPEWGWFGTYFAVRLACGLDVPKFYDIRPRIAHRGNVRQFYPEPKLPPLDWAEVQRRCR